jgi:hypothetical protein
MLRRCRNHLRGAKVGLYCKRATRRKVACKGAHNVGHRTTPPVNPLVLIADNKYASACILELTFHPLHYGFSLHVSTRALL